MSRWPLLIFFFPCELLHFSDFSMHRIPSSVLVWPHKFIHPYALVQLLAHWPLSISELYLLHRGALQWITHLVPCCTARLRGLWRWHQQFACGVSSLYGSAEGAEKACGIFLSSGHGGTMITCKWSLKQRGEGMLSYLLLRLGSSVAPVFQYHNSRLQACHSLLLLAWALVLWRGSWVPEQKMFEFGLFNVCHFFLPAIYRFGLIVSNICGVTVVMLTGF